MTGILILNKILHSIFNNAVDFAEMLGRFTADLFLNAACLMARLLKLLVCLSKKLYTRFLMKQTKALKERFRVAFFFLKKIYKKARIHATVHGFFSGIAHFFSEAKQCLSRNSEQVLKIVNRTAPFVAMVALLIAFAGFSNVTLAYEVSYSGETLGYISGQEVLSKASDIVNDKLPEQSRQLTTQPQLSVKLVNSGMLSDADRLSQAIINNSAELTDGYGVYIDGSFFAAAKSREIIESTIAEIRSDYKQMTDADIAEICEKTEIRSGLFYQSQVYSASALKIQLGERISVRTVASSTVNKPIGYKTVTAKDNTKYEGYRRVSVTGVKGVQKSTVQTVYIDGVKSSSKVISTIVSKQPVDEQIIVGTRSLPSMTIEASARYCWPVARVSSSYVSCYFAYGGHKGIDIAAPNGTQIYAAASGVVTEVEYSGSSYGNQFIVKCGDGVYHRYAHCSRIDVEVGDVVTVGEPIAKVGSTGNSTGPHLHFEVYINGNLTNPAPYLGLN